MLQAEMELARILLPWLLWNGVLAIENRALLIAPLTAMLSPRLVIIEVEKNTVIDATSPMENASVDTAVMPQEVTERKTVS